MSRHRFQTKVVTAQFFYGGSEVTYSPRSSATFVNLRTREPRKRRAPVQIVIKCSIFPRSSRYPNGRFHCCCSWYLLYFCVLTFVNSGRGHVYAPESLLSGQN